MSDESDEGNIIPICWVCGCPLEWTGEYRTLELEGGQFVVDEPIYICSNPDCDDLDEYD